MFAHTHRLLRHPRRLVAAAAGAARRHYAAPTPPAARRALPPPVAVSPAAQDFLGRLAASAPCRVAGFTLSLDQAQSNMHMVFRFDILSADGAATTTAEKAPFGDDDALALYVDSSALMKVLGATVDFDTESRSLVVLDKHGEPIIPDT